MNTSDFYERRPMLDKCITGGTLRAWKNMTTRRIKYVAVGQYPPGVHYRVQPDGGKMLCTADGRRSIFDDVDL